MRTGIKTWAAGNNHFLKICKKIWIILEKAAETY